MWQRIGAGGDGICRGRRGAWTCAAVSFAPLSTELGTLGDPSGFAVTAALVRNLARTSVPMAASSVVEPAASASNPKSWS